MTGLGDIKNPKGGSGVAEALRVRESIVWGKAGGVSWSPASVELMGHCRELRLCSEDSELGNFK